MSRRWRDPHRTLVEIMTRAFTHPGGITHWVPDLDRSPLTACGLNIDKQDGAYSRSRTPWGKVPGCPVCRDKAAVNLTRQVQS